jgi:hypothetical protein
MRFSAPQSVRTVLHPALPAPGECGAERVESSHAATPLRLADTPAELTTQTANGNSFLSIAGAMNSVARDDSHSTTTIFRGQGK